MSIAPAHALALLGASDLSDAERVYLAYHAGAWVRPEQAVPSGDWRSCTYIAGRGWGKSYGIAYEINRRVEAGECRSPVLMAPSDDRTRDAQVRPLVELSPPWFRAEPFRDGVIWPNGVWAEPHTAAAPGKTRGGNYDLAWLTELVDWPANTRREAYENVTTATRVGQRPQVLCDTTSKGKNELIQALIEQHTAAPHVHLLHRGTVFDNPTLPPGYLRAEIAKYIIGSRRYDEELLGLVFDEATGALWQQSWIDEHRSAAPPQQYDVRVVGLDPALSSRRDADETGIVVASRDTAGHIHIEDDLSGRYPPEEWSRLVVGQCIDRGASGVIVERNHAGDMPRDLIKVEAARRGWRIEILPNPDRPFPARRSGVVHIREVVSTRKKEARASAPAALYQQGRVHHVGELQSLEHELTMWEPGTRNSPNRLDALVFCVAELAGIAARDHGGREAIQVASQASRAMRDGTRRSPSLVLGGARRVL